MAKIALYARVSKAEDQTTTNQLLQLRAWATAHPGIETIEYEEAITSRKTRPHKEAILRQLRTGELQGVVFVSLSRWGRSTTELVGELRELHALGRNVVSLKEGLNLDSAAGRALVGMLAVFAEFERDLIRERTLDGLARARAQGKVLGWRKGRKRGPLPENSPRHATEDPTAPITSVIASALPPNATGVRQQENPSTGGNLEIANSPKVAE